MRTPRLLTITCAAGFLAGCGVQEADFGLEKGPFLSVWMDEDETRVSFDGTSGSLTWLEGDEIAVYVTGSGYRKATVTETSSAVLGKVHMDEADFANRTCYAVYPYEARNATYYGNTDLAVSLPDTYDISAQLGTNPAKVPMVAVNNAVDNLLRFHQVGGLLQVTCDKVPAGTETLRVTLDQPVTGDFLVDAPETTLPTITIESALGGNTNTVTFTVAGSGGLSAATNGIILNVPVPCGTYQSVTVSACGSGGSVLAEGSTTTAHTFLRRHGWKLAPFGQASVSYVCEGMSPTAVTSDYNGGAASLATAFKSYKTSGGTSTAVAFAFQYSEDDGVTWNSGLPDWMSAGSGMVTSGSIAGQVLPVTVAAQAYSLYDAHREHMLARGEYTTAKDLSTVNVATGGTVARTTANCYVVDRPGKYKFPLVYGNGVYNNGNNLGAYRGTTNGTSYRVDAGVTGYLGSFKDHNNANIYNNNDAQSSPYLTTHLNKAASNFTPVLLWTDAPGLVRNNLSISGSGTDTYLNFEVPKETITEGNAVVAVKVGGQIAWSWHIWVTDEDLTQVKTVSNGQQMEPVSIGWCYGHSFRYEARTCLVRAFQPESGRVSEAVTVTQEEATVSNTHGTTTYYQWGRKDPFLGETSASAYTLKSAYYYSDEPAQKIQTVRVTIGGSIQNPCVFYCYPEDNGIPDWCSSSYNNTWNSSFNGQDYNADIATVKTIYDPSPVGFKLPTRKAFDQFDYGNNFVWSAATATSSAGCTYTSAAESLFFPICGSRNSRVDANGFHLQSTEGSYWTCMPVNKSANSNVDEEYWYALPLRFNSTTLNLDRIAEWRLDGKPVFPIVGDK